MWTDDDRRRYFAEYRAKNMDRIRELAKKNSRERRARNPSKVRAYDAAYRARNLEKIRAIQAASKRRTRAENPTKAHESYKKHRAKFRDRLNAQARNRYAKNPSKSRRYSANYRKRNHDKTVAVVKRWRREYPEKAKAIGRAWHDANLDKVRMHRRTRRATLAGAQINDLTLVQWKTIQEAFKHRCAYCLKQFKGKLTQDHIVPLSKGGHHTAGNIVPACRSCNSKKHTSPPLIPVQPLLIV